MKRDAPVRASTSDAPLPQYPIESVDNALKIILLLGERAELRLTDVSKYLNVASSTAHRLLAMLQYRGFVRQDRRTKSYRPGTALTGVAFSILQSFDVRATVRPFLEKLNVELEETVHLGVLDGNTVRFIDAVESPRAVRVTARLGRSMPAHCASTGKAMLAQLSASDLKRLYPDDELPGMTQHSIRSRAELEQELDIVRRRGFATSNEESEDGVCSLAVAFSSGDTPTQVALNVAVPINRMNPAQNRLISESLRSVVSDAEKLLHG